jgi:hypothetical protein
LFHGFIGSRRSLCGIAFWRRAARRQGEERGQNQKQSQVFFTIHDANFPHAPITDGLTLKVILLMSHETFYLRRKI